MPPHTPVRMIRSKKYTDIAERAANHTLERKHTLNARVRARLGHPFELELRSCITGQAARIQGDVVEQAH